MAIGILILFEVMVILFLFLSGGHNFYCGCRKAFYRQIPYNVFSVVPLNVGLVEMVEVAEACMLAAYLVCDRKRLLSCLPRQWTRHDI